MLLGSLTNINLKFSWSHNSIELLLWLGLDSLTLLFRSLGHVRLFTTPWTATRQASLSFTILEFIQTYVHWVSDATQPSHCPLLLPPSIFPSIMVFSNESVLPIRWPKCWSFSFSISPSNEYSGLISFRIDWFDPLAVQGTLKSLLQHHSSKASVLWHSAFL